MINKITPCPKHLRRCPACDLAPFVWKSELRRNSDSRPRWREMWVPLPYLKKFKIKIEEIKIKIC